MTASKRITERGLRKRLLRLEAETYRLEMVANLQELRRPMTHLRRAPALLGLLGGKHKLIGRVAEFLSARRLDWIVKSIPLVLAGWRIAMLARDIFDRRSRRASASPD
jgi:hypothetical protein